jgi:hypothetical protein
MCNRCLWPNGQGTTAAIACHLSLGSSLTFDTSSCVLTDVNPWALRTLWYFDVGMPVNHRRILVKPWRWLNNMTEDLELPLRSGWCRARQFDKGHRGIMSLECNRGVHTKRFGRGRASWLHVGRHVETSLVTVRGVCVEIPMSWPSLTRHPSVRFPTPPNQFLLVYRWHHKVHTKAPLYSATPLVCKWKLICCGVRNTC